MYKEHFEELERSTIYIRVRPRIQSLVTGSLVTINGLNLTQKNNVNHVDEQDDPTEYNIKVSSFGPGTTLVKIMDAPEEVGNESQEECNELLFLD